MVLDSGVFTFMSLILLSVVTSWVLSSTNSQDLVNERFVAPREKYEELWQINCPKPATDSIQPELTLQLCMVLDARFEQSQTCDWWQNQVDQADYTEAVQALFFTCTGGE